MFVFDRETEGLTEVDRGLHMLHGALAGFELSWSHDSRWIAWSRGLETTNSAVFLFDTEAGERFQVTSGYYNDFRPVFDPAGKHLYYYSNRTLAPVYSDLDATWVYPNATNIVAATLRDDVPSPLAPRNDEEPVAPDDDEDEPGEDESGEETAGEADEAGPGFGRRGRRRGGAARHRRRRFREPGRVPTSPTSTGSGAGLRPPSIKARPRWAHRTVSRGCSTTPACRPSRSTTPSWTIRR